MYTPDDYREALKKELRNFTTLENTRNITKDKIINTYNKLFYFAQKLFNEYHNAYESGKQLHQENSEINMTVAGIKAELMNLKREKELLIKNLHKTCDNYEGYKEATKDITDNILSKFQSRTFR